MPNPVEELKSEAKVKWIGLMPHPETGHLVHLGGRDYGKVYYGAVHYDAPSGESNVREAAIKIFHKPLTPKLAEKYQRAINDLHEAGWPMKGVFMHKIRREDEKSFHELGLDVLGVKSGHFVQVMPLKGSEKGSGLVNLKRGENIQHSVETLWETIKLMAQAANAGYAAPKDFVHVEKNKIFGFKHEVLPWDIDLLVRGGKQDPESLALHIDSQLYDLNSPKQDLSAMKRRALLHTKGEQKEALLRLWPYLRPKN